MCSNLCCKLLLGANNHFVQNLKGLSQAEVYDGWLGLGDLDFKLRLAFIADESDGYVVEPGHHAAEFKIAVKVCDTLNWAALNRDDSPWNGVVAGVIDDRAANDLGLKDPRRSYEEEEVVFAHFV